MCQTRKLNLYNSSRENLRAASALADRPFHLGAASSCETSGFAFPRRFTSEVKIIKADSIQEMACAGDDVGEGVFRKR